MPNNTLNILTRMDGGPLTPLQKFMSPLDDFPEREFLDFNKIVEMPEDWAEVSQVDELLRPSKGLLPVAYRINLSEHGFKNKVEWATACWGTKWNSYSNDKNGEGKDWTELRFYTAWEPPIPIIRELASKTRVALQLDFADEGGFWLGRFWVEPWGNESKKLYYEAKYAPKDLKEFFRHGEYSDNFVWEDKPRRAKRTKKGAK
jgi:hypothetical protein